MEKKRKISSQMEKSSASPDLQVALLAAQWRDTQVERGRLTDRVSNNYEVCVSFY